jgi:hypothetical protein
VGLKRELRNRSLTVVMLTLFLLFWVGHSLAGWRHQVEELREHGRPAITWTAYLRSADFLESTAENWESEFFQMAAFVFLSAFLFQRGAAESSKLPEEKDDEKDDELEPRPGSPGPVHRGGLALALYSHSLTLALFALFVVSFALHALGGARQYNEEAALHGQPSLTVGEYLLSSTFWFQSFQNWQSEFLSVAVLVVLSIFLRQRGSPESKAVNAPHAQTGAS